MAMQEESEENEDALMAELIRLREGTDEDIKDIDEDNLDYNENALHIENSVLEEMERENSLHNIEGKEYLNYEWIDLDEIDKYNIVPACLKEILKQKQFPVHRIYEDN